MLELRILGPLDVLVDGKALALGSPKQRALLTLLSLHVGEAVSTDRLIGALEIFEHGLTRRNATKG